MGSTKGSRRRAPGPNQGSAGPDPGPRGFRLVALIYPEEQAEYRELTHQLSELSNRFTKTFDSTDAFPQR